MSLCYSCLCGSTQAQLAEHKGHNRLGKSVGDKNLILLIFFFYFTGLCPECSYKLNYHHKRKDVTRQPKAAKRSEKSSSKKHKAKKRKSKHKHKHRKHKKHRRHRDDSSSSSSSSSSEDDDDKQSGNAKGNLIIFIYLL